MCVCVCVYVCIHMHAVCVVSGVLARETSKPNAVVQSWRFLCTYEPGTYNNGHTLSLVTCGHLHVGDVVRVLIVETEETPRSRLTPTSEIS